jgi:serine/threonine protein kinase
MPLPVISEKNIKDLFPEIDSAAEIGKGGQKLVFRVLREGTPLALKFALLPDTFHADAVDIDETVLRAQRETQIMQDCNSPHMVKLGPIVLGTAVVEGQNVLYFSEELVEGQALNEILRASSTLPYAEVIKLGKQMCSAVSELWSLGKIHRDIKPGNIMRRNADGSYVLLDAGLAFDVAGESISAGFMVGTMAYFSPEQFDYTSRRTMDFRSDIFSLGVTLCQALTGEHPFFSATTSTPHLFTRITKHNPPPPSSIRPGIPTSLDRIILRMMGKSPHLRFRRIEQLQAALAEVEEQ